MLKENRMMLAALRFELTPYDWADACSYEMEGEMRLWYRFFKADPSREQVLATCLRDQIGCGGYICVDWSRVWVPDETVDALIQDVFAFTEIPVPQANPNYDYSWDEQYD